MGKMGTILSTNIILYIGVRIPKLKGTLGSESEQKRFLITKVIDLIQGV